MKLLNDACELGDAGRLGGPARLGRPAFGLRPCLGARSPRIFLSTRKLRRRENFGKKSLGRRDGFRPKIVEIGAILAIFEPFEV